MSEKRIDEEKFLNDPEVAKKAKERTKRQNIIAKAEAKKTYIEHKHKSDERFASEYKALENEISALEQGESPDKKSKIKELKKKEQALKQYHKRDLNQLKSNYNHDRSHRSFLDATDAFLSRPPRWIYSLVLFLVILGIFIYFSVEEKLFVNTAGTYFETVKEFFQGFFVPDYQMFFGTGEYTFVQSTLYLCIQTFAIAFLGTLLASLFAIPFGFLASKKLFGKWSYISTVILIIIRTIPEIIFCYVFIMVSGFSPITGVVVLSIQSIGMIGKMYSDNLDGMDMTFLEAYDSCGGTRFDSIRVGVMPQVLPGFLSTILYRFDLNLRTATILGLVGAGDMGRLILQYSQQYAWRQLGSLMWGLLVMVVLTDLLSTYLRKKLV